MLASSFKNSVPGSVPAGSFTGRAPSISPPTFMQQPMGTPHSLNRDRLLERSDIENYLAILRSSIDVDQSMPPSLQGVGGTATQGAWDEEDELDKFRKQSEDILALSQVYRDKRQKQTFFLFPPFMCVNLGTFEPRSGGTGRGYADKGKGFDPSQAGRGLYGDQRRWRWQ